MSNRSIKRVRLAMAVALATAIASTAPQQTAAQTAKPADGFVVVVNANNPTTVIARADLAKLFTKKARAWADGTPAFPIDLTTSNPVRDVFTQRVHGKSARAISSYWQQQIFSGREVPPPERKNDDEVLDYIRSNPGAVGYVSSSARLGNGVKAITVSGV